MQAYFFPYIGYFQLIDSVDTFILYEYVSFRKKSWITRNRILDKGKQEPIYINTPVIGKSSNKLINEVFIVDDIKWKKKLLNLTYFNYKKAIYFNDIYPFLENIIYNDQLNLHKYNSHLIVKICELLDIKTEIIDDNLSNKFIEKELEHQQNINRENVKSERIFRLCKKYKANSYINPIGGTELYSKDYFLQNNLQLYFLKTKDFSYHQFNNSFTPNLSIIDILMHKGINYTKEIIKQDKTLK